MPANVATARTRTGVRWLGLQIDFQAISAWVLSLALVIYLGLDGGGYSISSHGQVGIVVWWVVVLCAAWGLLPVSSLTRGAKWTLGLLGAFTVWNALAITWSISSGRSFADLALVSCYFGIAVLGVAIHRDRAVAVRHTTAAVATAIVVITALALASRLWPHLFSGSLQTAQILGQQSRLSWPLNYWNALATLMAIGLPLLLAQASTARTLVMQGLAAAAIPLVALCAAFTLSRGGVIECAFALVVFLLLAHDRLAKLATILVTGAGSAILIYGGLHRHALQHGLVGGDQPHEAHALLIAIVVVCVGVGLAQAGIGLAVRHATRPAFLTPSPARARALGAGALVVIVIVALFAGAPHRLDHAWKDFKNPVNTSNGSSVARYSSTSGDGRYQYWVAGVHSAAKHPLTGSGPGTFQLDWLPREPFNNYVTNAHSLYVETYVETGLVGLALLLGFLVTALLLAIRAARRFDFEERTASAAIVAALVAFMVAAAFDWVWQMPVLVAAILLPLGAIFAREQTPITAVVDSAGHRPGIPTQLAGVLAGLICLVAIALPLATASAITASQDAVQSGDLPQAQAEARSAVRLESGSGAAQLQLALVDESLHDLPAALKAAEHAVSNEPQNWAAWLVLSRLRAKSGNARGAIAAYEHAKSLNPYSPLFAS